MKPMRRRKIAIFTIALALTGCILNGKKVIRNFEDCAEAGNPVMESYPRQCQTEDGWHFIENTEEAEEVETADLSDLIRVIHPKANTVVQSPVVIEGEARGTFFFEASFPVWLKDKEGRLIAQGHGEAQGEWMTEAFVPFRAELEWKSEPSQEAMLVLQKDDPSGMQQNLATLQIPLKIGKQASTKQCRATGCSGQLCAEEEAITTCEFLPEYTCYKQATCERQKNGECGWTETKALTECLANQVDN